VTCLHYTLSTGIFAHNNLFQFLHLDCPCALAVDVEVDLTALMFLGLAGGSASLANRVDGQISRGTIGVVHDELDIVLATIK